MPTTYIKKILEATVYDVARETPIQQMDSMSEALGNTVLVKREDLQPVHSFKLRGAYNKISKIPPARRKHGVVAASAGNHAQGIAMAANKLNVHATIIMPITTPGIKIKAVKALGGKNIAVKLHGDRFDEANVYAKEFARKHSAVLIPPYDDPDVIAGQGTIGMEILRQWSGPLHAIFVPVGGGGLIAGIAAYIKYLRPEIKIIGVEAEDSACLQAALKAGRRVELKTTGIFADGVAVAQIGKEPFRIARECVDEVVTVSSDEICAAIKDLFDDTRSITEPAGALSLAGLKKLARSRRWKNKVLLNIASGANVDFDRLRYISERYEVGQQTEAMLAVTIPEAPGSLMGLCDALNDHDITEFNYRGCAATSVNIFVGIKLSGGKQDRRQLIQMLRDQGYSVTDMSGNELAKMHVCHMVGGHSDSPKDERLFSFEFPERPGILRDFLKILRGRWNISLFHYRRHGGTYAHVFVGLQPLSGSPHHLSDFLEELSYPYVEETHNPAYRMFLK